MINEIKGVAAMSRASLQDKKEFQEISSSMKEVTYQLKSYGLYRGYIYNHIRKIYKNLDDINDTVEDISRNQHIFMNQMADRFKMVEELLIDLHKKQSINLP